MTSSTTISNERDSRLTYYAPVWIIAGLMLLGALLVYPYLPDTIPTHWGFSGEPDAWGSKWPAAFIPVFIGVGFAVLFPLFERIDPKRMNYKDFRPVWRVIQISLITFMAYIQAITYYVTLHPDANNVVGSAIIGGVGALFIILGNYMGKLRQNWFIGLRTPWTLSDPEVWQKSQRLTGWMFVFAGVMMLVMAVTGGIQPHIFFGVIVAIVIIPVVYSYVLHAKKQKERKKTG